MTPTETSKAPTPRRSPSLRWSLLALIFLCWVVPIILLLSISSGFARRSTLQRVSDIVTISIENEMANLRRSLQQVMNDAISLSYTPVVRNAYGVYQAGGGVLELYNAGRDLLNQQFSRSQIVRAAYLLFPHVDTGVAADCYTYNPATIQWAEAKTFYETGADAAALAMMDGLDTEIGFFTAGGRLYLVRNLSLLDNRYRPYAMLAVEINTATLMSGLDKLPWLSGIAICVNDVPMVRRDHPVLSPIFLSQAYESSESLLKGNALTVYGAPAGERFTLHYSVTADLEPLIRQMGGTADTVLLVALLAVPLMGLVLLFFLRRVNRPITALSQVARRIDAGEFGAQTDTDRYGSAEFDYLAAQLNTMSARLLDQFECLYRDELALRDAQIKALQSQINPHFLGNTLEIINWEARLAGNAKVSRMLEALSTILQATQARDARPLVHLSEELMVIGAYLYVIGQRLGKRLEVRQEIDPALLDWYVPRLILQPIVENAVEHGVSARQRGAIVIRAVSVDAAWMRLEVENDAPMSKQDTERVRRLLSEEARDGEASGNIGIRNVHQRLRILYGEGSGLTIETTKNGHTVSSLCIQKREEPQDKQR